MERNGKQRAAFSFVELLVVTGLIAVLIAILLPMMARVRSMARSTVCLAHVQQWGQSFEMYLSSNEGHPLSTGSHLPPALQWWEFLAPYNGDVQGCLICPGASESRAGPPDRTYRTYKHGTAFYAWELVTYDAGEPQWIERGYYRGSYGINEWALSYKYAPKGLIRYPPKDADRIPLLGDCATVYTHPSDDGAPIPTNLQGIETKALGVGQYCLDRHATAVNIVFLDGHAERISLNELWQLKWSEAFVPRDVVLPND